MEALQNGNETSNNKEYLKRRRKNDLPGSTCSAPLATKDALVLPRLSLRSALIMAVKRKTLLPFFGAN